MKASWGHICYLYGEDLSFILGVSYRLMLCSLVLSLGLTRAMQCPVLPGAWVEQVEAFPHPHTQGLCFSGDALP